jgi:RNA polymerase sigma factor (sigma-70 family)
MASAEVTGLVFIVDDDPAVGIALQRLLDSVGLRSEAFVRADEFLSRMPSNVPSCLIADVRMPRISGLELQKALHGELEMPVIILSAHLDVRQAVRAMRGGAVTVIAKPFNDQDLLDAVQTALDQDAERRQQKRDRAQLAERYDTLTARQREVMALVVTGLTNKETAARLGTSEKTIKIHRARVMQKMKAESLVALVRVADRLQQP